MQEFDLTDKQVDEIKKLNARLTVLKNLLNELNINNDFLYNKLIDDLAETQQKYDDWFLNFQTENKIITTPKNYWNVIFDAKKIQLLE